MKVFNQAGFTLLEVIIVVAVLAAFSTIVVAGFMIMQKQADLENNTQEFANVLKLAQSKTLASNQDARYGVYIDTFANPNKYVLFKGMNFAARDSAFDQNFWVSKSVEFFNINVGGGSELVFEKLTGALSQPGDISLRYKTDITQTKTVYAASSGTIGFLLPQIPSDDARVKDSRHLHFDYSRAINTSTENIVLSFNNGAVVQTIPVAQNLSGSQINWEGTVTVGGAGQTVRIATHNINNPQSQFSVHRDRRFNTVSLKITLSGDVTGSLADYSTDGLMVNHTSIYASNFIWQ